MSSQQMIPVNRFVANLIEANQAVALQYLFTVLTERAFSTDSSHHLESFVRLALQAQSQSRCTLEAISNIKHQRFGNASH